MDLGVGDDPLDTRDREGVVEAGAPDLGGVPAAPDFPAQRPAYLHALRALDDGPGRPDERAGRDLLDQPLADPARPRALRPLGEPQRLLPAKGVHRATPSSWWSSQSSEACPASIGTKRSRSVRYTPRDATRLSVARPLCRAAPIPEYCATARRTSENPLGAKFREQPFHAIG